jgi:hypothetical protein
MKTESSISTIFYSSKKERKSSGIGFTKGTGGRGDPRKRVLSKERNLIDGADFAW